jgi:hypothetical protein
MNRKASGTYPAVRSVNLPSPGREKRRFPVFGHGKAVCPFSMLLAKLNSAEKEMVCCSILPVIFTYRQVNNI